MTKLRLIKDGFPSSRATIDKWRILVVDDDPDIHAITRMALKNFSFHERGVEILCAQSAAGARRVLETHSDIAVILLDVVMETEEAGLQLVRYIREELCNANVRIIMRTGQPGLAPEEEIVVRYDVNGYRSKTDLTIQKLFSATVTALRTYEQLSVLDIQRRGLRQIIEASDNLHQEASLRLFACGVLTQLGSFLGVGSDGVICLKLGNSGVQLLAASDVYGDVANLSWETLPVRETVRNLILSTFNNMANQTTSRHSVRYLRSDKNDDVVVFMDCARPEASACELLELFCNKITKSFSNVFRGEPLPQANTLLEEKLNENT